MTLKFLIEHRVMNKLSTLPNCKVSFPKFLSGLWSFKTGSKQNQSLSSVIHSITDIAFFLGEIAHCDNNKKNPLQQFKGFSEKK